jgi:hypothetical protein
MRYRLFLPIWPHEEAFVVYAAIPQDGNPKTLVSVLRTDVTLRRIYLVYTFGDAKREKYVSALSISTQVLIEAPYM